MISMNYFYEWILNGLIISDETMKYLDWLDRFKDDHLNYSSSTNFVRRFIGVKKSEQKEELNFFCRKFINETKI